MLIRMAITLLFCTYVILPMFELDTETLLNIETISIMFVLLTLLYAIGDYILMPIVFVIYMAILMLDR